METDTKSRFLVILLSAGVVAGSSVVFTPIGGLLVCILILAVVPKTEGHGKVF